MTAHHNPKDKTILYQPGIAVLHIQRAKAVKFNRATSALEKMRTSDSHAIGTIVAAGVFRCSVDSETRLSDRDRTLRYRPRLATLARRPGTCAPIEMHP
jgi:hypothetical protein